VIRKITESITTLSVPFKRFGRIQIGGRGTLGMITSRKSGATDVDISVPLSLN
jgi:hypothetical protein